MDVLKKGAMAGAFYESFLLDKDVNEIDLLIEDNDEEERTVMKVVVLSGTPKSEGLSASCVAAAVAGAEKAGASVAVIDLCKTGIGRCKVCGDGWGICRNEHVCAYGEDGFDEVSKEIAGADAWVIQSPVYWGETSEALKSFLDRFRRARPCV